MTTENRNTDWIVRVRPNPRAPIRLFCFPYAGGGASVYRRWATSLPDFIEVCAVQLPGREQRIREDAYQTMDDLIPALCQGLSPHLDRPYAFFGHSMGAMVCFELARRIRRNGRPGPRLLLVSGNKAPHLPALRPPLHRLPGAALWQALHELDGLEPEVAANEELRELLTPTLRADFAVCENYVFQPEPPLPCPITALGGQADQLIDPGRVGAWAEQTTGAFRLHLFPGGHFFVNTARQAVLQVVAQELMLLEGRAG